MSRMAPTEMLAVPRLPGQLYARGQKVHMRYAEEIDLDNIITGLGEYIWRLNNIFDPNQTGTGHQPLSHDQWAALYKNYIVYGAKATVTLIASGNSSAIAASATACMALSDTGSSITDIQTAIESPFSKFIKIGPNDGSGAQTMETGYIDISKMPGNKGAIYDANQWGAPFGQSPSNELFVHIVATADDSTSIRLNVMMVIDYYVWVYEPADLLVS